MSLVGFKAVNHPQQTFARGARDETDDRGTTLEHFIPWNASFDGFMLDVAAAIHNAKCERYFTRDDDGLLQPWAGEKIWRNPPYSNICSWIERAWREYASTRGIVMLLPANRVEQKWWQELVEPFRGRGVLTVEFLPGRMRFDRPGAVIGPKGDRPPFGHCLLIWKDSTCAHFSLRGEANNARMYCSRCGRVVGHSGLPVLKPRADQKQERETL